MQTTGLDVNKIVTDLVSRNLDKMVSGIRKFGKDQIADIQIETLTAFEKYLLRSADKYSKSKTLIHRSTSVPLYDFYVHTELALGQEIIETEYISSILQRSKYSMILGSGGTGKSTLFKHLFLNSIYTSDKIPIFVPLRDINGTELSLLDCMYDSLTTLGFSLQKDYFAESLDKGIYIFFFDGFDEVDQERQPKVIREISNMITRFSENYYLVSSRVTDNLSTGWDEFTDFTMRPLSLKKASVLIDKLPYDQETTGKFKEKLEAGLFYELQSFCSNPLLLTLMLMTFDEFGDIPDKLHIFYGQAYDVLSFRHDGLKPGYKRPRRTDADHLGSDGFTQILEAISAVSYFDGNVSFTGTQLTDYLNKAKALERLEFKSEDYKEDLISTVCILILDGLRYNYQHRSFQEYFTARFINRQPDEKQKRALTRLSREKSSSMRSDQVLNILMDLNRTMVEKQFIIPVLREIRENVMESTKEETYIKAIKLYTRGVRGMAIEKPTGVAIRFQADLSGNRGNQHLYAHITLINFINEFYTKIPVYASNLPAIHKDSLRKEFRDADHFIAEMSCFFGDDSERLNRIIERIFGESERKHQVPVYIPIRETIDDPSLQDEIILMCNFFLMNLENCFVLLEQLEKEHHELDSLF